jgi:flagellar hook-associated protein 1 FlgK
MTLNSMIGSATSGLLTAQTQLRVVSDNIANVNTPGYSRKIVDQESVSLSAMGGGVDVNRIERSVDQFLQQAGYTASAQSGAASTISDMLDRAQALFGDPTTSNGFFNKLDQVFSDLSAAAQDPASSVSRSQALNSLSNFFDQAGSISGQLQSLGHEADSRISDSVSQINALVSQISSLNTTISNDTAAKADPTGAQNAQSQLIDKLSSMVDISVYRRQDGGLDIRSGDGSLLVGRSGAATLSFSTGGATPGQILVASAGGTAHPMQPLSGTVAGLMKLRNAELPSVMAQLGEYVTQAANAINQAHNASSAVPPPAQLTGRNTGLDLPTAVSGFTGKTTIAIVDQTGTLQSRVDIDFDAGTMSTDGGPAAGFTPASFLATLNGALGANGSASFNNGVLSLQASAGNGVSIADDPTTPSMKAGRGFSQFFGLNDLVSSTGFPYPATGLVGTDPNGFNAGGVISMRLLDSNGATLRDASVTVPAGGDMNALIAALNDPATGVGLYGSFALNSVGELNFTPNAPGINVSVSSDTTQRGPGGPSLSSLFGIDPKLRYLRAAAFSVRPDIAANSMQLAMAQFDLTATAGQPALSPGDARGGLQLAAAGQQTIAFDPAGPFGAQASSLVNYAAQFSGSVAQQSAAATGANSNAQAVAQEANARRASVEGVNLDQELVNMTTYQQAYNASARMLTAVDQLYQTLLNIQ